MANRACVLLFLFSRSFPSSFSSLPSHLYCLFLFFLKLNSKEVLCIHCAKGSIMYFVRGQESCLLACLLASLRSKRLREASEQRTRNEKQKSRLGLSQCPETTRKRLLRRLVACTKRCIDGLYQTACLNHKSTKCSLTT